MKKILNYCYPYRWGMLWGLTMKMTGAMAELVLPWVLSYMIDKVIPQKSVNKIILFGFLMLACTVAACILNITANRKASKVSRDVTEQIRNDLFRKMSYLSNSQVDEITLPSMISRLTTDTYNIHNMISMAQRLGVRAPFMFLGGIIMTLSLDWFLTLMMLSMLPFIVIMIILVYRKALPMFRLLQIKIDRFVRVVREDAAGIRVIKALSKTDYEKRKFHQINSDVVEQDQMAGRTMGILNPGMNLFLNIGLVLVILAGAYRVNRGLTQPGEIIAFMTYVVLILNAVLFISRMFVISSRASASASRVTEILALEPQLKVGELPREDTPYHVEFRNVSFAYRGQKSTLSDINFALKRGETLGIIGATGSGKTALIQLLMRFYDVAQGRILIGGRNVKSIDMETLRRKFGVVFQNDILFNQSIYENIRFGRDLTDEQIMNAVSYARAKDFIDGKKGGMEDTVSIKGANLSGGQKQRVLIARALAAEPEILILDDSSSALDYKTDAALRGEIRTHFSDTTTIMIAQRISSVMFADHILVLDEGRTIGYGTHEELMRDCEIYREISQSQMGGE